MGHTPGVHNRHQHFKEHQTLTLFINTQVFYTPKVKRAEFPLYMDVSLASSHILQTCSSKKNIYICIQNSSPTHRSSHLNGSQARSPQQTSTSVQSNDRVSPLKARTPNV